MICICSSLCAALSPFTDRGVFFFVVLEKNFPLCNDRVLHLGINHVCSVVQNMLDVWSILVLQLS